MGNIITRDTNDTIHWNSLKTDKISEDNNFSSMSNDSKLLLNRLELNLQKGGGESEVMSDIDNIFSKPIFNNVNASKPLVGGGGLLDVLSETETKEEVKNDLSDTSPFISSEMYNLLMKNNNEIQQGGSIQKGGKIEGDDSSTSSTSSSNDNSDDSDDSSSESEKKKKQNKKGKKNLKGGNKKVVSESSNSNELSYISSSAHTGKSDEHSASPSVSESASASSVKSKSSKKSNSVEDYESSSDSYVTSEKSNENSTIKNLNNNLPNSSINTSDINMITE